MDDKIKKSYEKVNLSEASKKRIQMAVMMDKEEHGKIRKKWNTMSLCSRVAAVLALVFVLGSGSAFAASRIFHMKEFLQNLPEDAEPYINKEVSTANAEDKIQETDKEYVVSDEILEELKDKVSFVVKETVSDRSDCSILVEAILNDPENYMLVAEEYGVSKQDDGYMPAKEYYEDAKEGESIEEYATRNGKQILLVESSLSDDEIEQGKYMEGFSGKIEDPSHALLHIGLTADLDKSTGFADGTRIQIANRVSLYVNNGEVMWQECKNENRTVTLEKVATKEDSAFYAFADGREMRVGDGPVIIKSIKLTNTPLETKVEFVAVNEDKELGNWVSINLIDDEGNIFDRGTSDGGYATNPDANGQFTDVGSYKRMEFPDHVNVRVRNLDTDDLYELKNIPIVK